MIKLSKLFSKDVEKFSDRDVEQRTGRAIGKTTGHYLGILSTAIKPPDTKILITYDEYEHDNPQTQRNAVEYLREAVDRLGLDWISFMSEGGSFYIIYRPFINIEKRWGIVDD